MGIKHPGAAAEEIQGAAERDRMAGKCGSAGASRIGADHAPPPASVNFPPHPFPRNPARPCQSRTAHGQRLDETFFGGLAIPRPEGRQRVAGGGATRNHRSPSHSDASPDRGARRCRAKFSRPAGAAGFFGGPVRWFRSCLAPPPATLWRPSGTDRPLAPSKCHSALSA